jgi:hypothetical protein
VRLRCALPLFASSAGSRPSRTRGRSSTAASLRAQRQARPGRGNRDSHRGLAGPAGHRRPARGPGSSSWAGGSTTSSSRRPGKRSPGKPSSSLLPRACSTGSRSRPRPGLGEPLARGLQGVARRKGRRGRGPAAGADGLHRAPRERGETRAGEPPLLGRLDRLGEQGRHGRRRDALSRTDRSARISLAAGPGFLRDAGVRPPRRARVALAS